MLISIAFKVRRLNPTHVHHCNVPKEGTMRCLDDLTQILENEEITYEPERMDTSALLLWTIYGVYLLGLGSNQSRR